MEKMKQMCFVKVSSCRLLVAIGPKKYNYYYRCTFATDKCRLPYYGGCPHTRVCETLTFSYYGVRCLGCVTGFVEDPANPDGECLRTLLMHNNYSVLKSTHNFPTAAINIALQNETYNADEGHPSIPVCAQVTAGTIEEGENFTAFLETTPHNASTGIIAFL